MDIGIVKVGFPKTRGTFLRPLHLRKLPFVVYDFGIRIREVEGLGLKTEEVQSLWLMR